jgi:diguanylate cyclase (GGDEF)-like protein
MNDASRSERNGVHHLDAFNSSDTTADSSTSSRQISALAPYDISEVLIDFARTMLTDFPIQSILDKLVGQIVEILPITSAGVTLIADDRAPRYIAASDDAALRFEKLQTELAEGPCLAAFYSGAAVAVPNIRADARFPLFAPRALASGLAAVFTFPLGHGEHQLGALDLYRDRPGVLTPAQMKSAQTLADVAGAYILNAQIRADLQLQTEQVLDASLHDSLTGLANRQLLLERLGVAFAHPKSDGHLLALCFIDVDNLKETNDVHGHSVGDQLLKAVAGRLVGLLRSGDTVARLSGDEFVILFEDIETTARVDAIAARIVSKLSGQFVLSDRVVDSTSSVGVALADRPDLSPEELLQNADQAMYQAKRGGGNQYRRSVGGAVELLTEMSSSDGV